MSHGPVVDTISSMNTITVPAAAKDLGVSPAWVGRLCRRHNIGEMITARMRLLSAKDLAMLRALVGTPPGPVPEKKPAKRKKGG